MSNTNTGGPAFPCEIYDLERDTLTKEEGMTLRDYFASKAMAGMIGLWTENSRHLKTGQSLADYVAEQAYFYADAMLKAREA